MSGGNSLHWRPPTTADVPAWVELMAAAEKLDQTGENLNEADLADEFESSSCDPRLDARFGFEPDGRLVAFAWAFGNRAPVEVHRVHLWGVVHPDRRRRGLGAAVLARLEGLADGLHHRWHAGGPGRYEVQFKDGDIARQTLVDGFGYRPIRYWFEMRRSLGDPVPEVPVPDGLRVGGLDPSSSETVRQAHNEAFADHWGASPRSEEDWRLWSMGRTFRPDLSFVAHDGEEVAGYLIAQHFPDDAVLKGYTESYVGQVGTRRPWRGRGVARTLLATHLRAAAREGLDYATLDVDAENPTGALGLYESLGFAQSKRWVTWAKDMAVAA
jgi:mycothiol synthase